MEIKAGNVARVGLCAGLLMSCSGGGGAASNGDMSCPLQAESCWNSAVAEAQACVPTTTGTLGADNRTCTFGDGTVALFDQPLSFPIDFSSVNTSVTITKSGTQCARFVQNESIVNVTLTTASGAHKIVTTLSGVTLTCGDGTKMATQWSDCETAPHYFDVTGQPATSFSGGASDISLSFQGYFPFDGGVSGFESWFTCVKP
jgi:hypothetical protein